MEPTKPRLNPYATAYIPLSQRQKESEYETLEKTSGDSGNTDDTSQFHLPDDISFEFAISNEGELFDPEDFSQISCQDYETGKQILNEDSQFEFLATRFPGFSLQSLVDVYSANGGDIETTVDMLTQLELQVDAVEHLPDTLDIGEASASGFLSSEAVVPRLKETTTGEASGSSGSVPTADQQ